MFLGEDLVDLVTPQALRTVQVQRRVDPVRHDEITLGDKARAPVVDVYGVGVRTAALARALNSIPGG